MPDFAEGVEQAAQAVHDQPTSPDYGGAIPAPAEIDAPDTTFGEADSDAMSILLAASQDQDTPPPAARPAETAPEAAFEPAATFASEYDGLSDDEIASRASTMSPAELRAAFGNGKAMTKGFNAKMREAADGQRALAEGQRQLALQQQQLLDSYRSLPTAPTPEAPAQAELDLSDVLDPITGEVNSAKLREAIKREAEAVADAKIAPLTAAQTQRQQQQEQAESQRIAGEINATLEHMRRAFPHFGNNPDVEQKVIDRMLATNNPDPMAVYASLHRMEYATTLYEFSQKQKAAQAATARTSPPAPSIRPGPRGPGVPVVPESMADSTDAMAKEIARLSGVPLRYVGE